MRRHNLKLDMALRGIVMTRGEEGATIDEMRSDYFSIYCEPWPLKRLNTKQIIAYLLQIDGLMMEKLDTGPCIWYIDDIGSNISERDLDSNNNIVAPTEVSSVAMTNLTENGVINEPTSNSYAIPAPLINRRMVTSSFVNDHVAGVSSVSSDGLIFMESIENSNEKSPKKRQHSQEILSVEHIPKKLKPVEADRLPLIVKNLYIHDRHNGANEMLKQATSTEKENSILVQIEPNGDIEAIDVNESIAPINKPEPKPLRKFTKPCQISEKPNFGPTQSINSGISMDNRLFPSLFGLVGDDFMRTLLSFELYGSDFTGQKDKRFDYCISSQTVRHAYHLVLDKQNQIASNYRYIIINVGAIDILAEHELIDIEASYVRLVKAIDMIGCQPIITTIPDLCINPNNPNMKIIRQTLLLFNQFLMDTYGDAYPVIDLYSAVPRSNINLNRNFYYFQQPKRINIEKRMLELWHWSDIGRKKIINAIENCIRKCTTT